MEKALIRWLRQRFGRTEFAQIGIGDDCAVLPATGSPLVLTCDAICDGVHFRASELTPQQIGRKALAVNLSDLASMGATAKSVLVCLTLPQAVSLEYAQQLFLGMEPLAGRFGVEICGGDTTVWPAGLVVMVTAIGLAPAAGVWTNSGARPGDLIVVTGRFGGSILKHHWSFEPRLDFAAQWRDVPGVVHACTDASDSLGFDLAKLAEASGVGFRLELDTVPCSRASVQLANTTGKSPLYHALSDGEDFELILAVPPDSWEQLKAAIPEQLELTRIGVFTSEPDWLMMQNGQASPFVPVGFEHQLA